MWSNGEHVNDLVERMRARTEAQIREVEAIQREGLQKLKRNWLKSCEKELSGIENAIKEGGKVIRTEILSQYRLLRRMTLLVWIWSMALIVILALLSVFLVRIQALPFLPPGVTKYKAEEGTVLVFPDGTQVFRTQDGRTAILIQRR